MYIYWINYTLILMYFSTQLSLPSVLVTSVNNNSKLPDARVKNLNVCFGVHSLPPYVASIIKAHWLDL